MLQTRYWFVGLLLVLPLLVACRSSPVRPGWSQTGMASWYGPDFHGRKTANGETYDMEAMTAAHKTLPFNTVVEVHNLDNGRKTTVRINDRGPFIRGRIIDLSKAAAREVHMIGSGTALVKIMIVEAAPSEAESSYQVQAGAYREKTRAETVADQLEKHFSQVQIEVSGAYYRVRVLGLLGRDSALKAQRLIRSLGYEALLIHSGP